MYEEGLREANALNLGREDLTKYAASLGLTLDQYEMLDRYLYAMAFISAWFHRHGDKARRDSTAHSAAILVASVGLNPPETIFNTVLLHERMWRHVFDAYGIGRRAGVGCAPILLVGGALGAVIA